MRAVVIRTVVKIKLCDEAGFAAGSFVSLVRMRNGLDGDELVGVETIVYNDSRYMDDFVSSIPMMHQSHSDYFIVVHGVVARSESDGLFFYTSEIDGDNEFAYTGMIKCIGSIIGSIKNVVSGGS